MLNLLAITLLAIIVKNPNMMQSLDGVDDDDEIVDALPTPVSNKVDGYSHYRDHSMAYQDLDMGGLVCLCMIAITLMLIYGAIKGKLMINLVNLINQLIIFCRSPISSFAIFFPSTL